MHPVTDIQIKLLDACKVALREFKKCQKTGNSKDAAIYHNAREKMFDLFKTLERSIEDMK